MVRISLVISFTKAMLSDTTVADFVRRSMSAPRLERFIARAARDSPALLVLQLKKAGGEVAEPLVCDVEFSRTLTESGFQNFLRLLKRFQVATASFSDGHDNA